MKHSKTAAQRRQVERQRIRRKRANPIYLEAERLRNMLRMRNARGSDWRSFRKAPFTVAVEAP